MDLDDKSAATRFILRREMGRGGMGIVYEAYDSRLERLVAVKTVHMEHSDTAYHQSVLAEAKAAAKIQHSNIVVIYEVAEQDDQLFIVMELMSGGSLDTVLRDAGPLPPLQATRHITAIFLGLVEAHRLGVLHRDIKPANVLLNHLQQAKLADFGLARIDSSHFGNRAGRSGTPGFMSPEQCKGDPLSFQSDYYSLAATFFALLTARAPFVGGSARQIMFEQCSLPAPDPRLLRPELPAQFQRFFSRALAQRSDQRFPSGNVFLEELRELARCVVPVPREPLSSGESVYFTYASVSPSQLFAPDSGLERSPPLTPAIGEVVVVASARQSAQQALLPNASARRRFGMPGAFMAGAFVLLLITLELFLPRFSDPPRLPESHAGAPPGFPTSPLPQTLGSSETQPQILQQFDGPVLDLALSLQDSHVLALVGGPSPGVAHWSTSLSGLLFQPLEKESQAGWLEGRLFAFSDRRFSAVQLLSRLGGLPMYRGAAQPSVRWTLDSLDSHLCAVDISRTAKAAAAIRRDKDRLELVIWGESKTVQTRLPAGQCMVAVSPVPEGPVAFVDDQGKLKWIQHQAIQELAVPGGEPALAMDFAAGGNFLAVLASTALRVISMAGETRATRTTSAGNALRYSPDSRLLVTAELSGKGSSHTSGRILTVWNARRLTRWIEFQHPQSDGATFQALLFASNTRLMAGDSAGRVFAWELPDNRDNDANR